jgi:cytoskeletal protein RodZ
MSNNNEIFMPENKSNKASIIVAVIAICLILGGVYLLNQSFSSNKPAETNTSTTTPTTKTETAKKEEVKPVVKENTVTDTTKTTTPTETATKPATTTTTPVTPVTTPTVEKQVLTPNQIIAKVLEVKSNGETVFQIQECGLKDATICKSPNKFNLSGVKAAIDKIYLVSGSISEENGRMSLENITIKENITT